MVKYFLNCFLLTLPILLWNIALADRLPGAFQSDIFWSEIPAALTYGENSSRIIVFIITLLMPLRVSTSLQKKGLVLYVIGTVVYFASWLLLILAPESAWSRSAIGFAAPAFTPALWLLGIGLIGDSLYFNVPYKRWMFIVVAAVFLILHNTHTLIVFFRMP